MKTFILDTSVLIHDPEAIFNFDENHVAIPVEVIQELDRIKTESTERGQAARSVQRKLLQSLATENLTDPTRLPNGGTLSLLLPPAKFLEQGNGAIKKVVGDMNLSDHKIIAAAEWLKQDHRKDTGPTGPHEVILVTKDMGMMLKGRAIGLHVEDYKFDKSPEVAPKTTPNIDLANTEVQQFLSNGFIELDSRQFEEPPINSYGLFLSEKKTPWRYIGCGRFTTLTSHQGIQIPNGTFIRARNLEQLFLLDALLNPDIHLVTAAGVAGTGKTLLTVAAGLHMIGKRNYTGICISKPNESIGKENGFLPGPQPLTAKILTPKGWTTMGEIQIGDKVIAWDGKPAKVLKILPQGKKMVSKIRTKEKKVTEACGDHPWLIKTYEEFKRNKSGTIQTTQSIEKNLTTAKGKPNARLPRNKTVKFQPQPLYFPAYTLGALLGDGNFGQAISLSCTEEEIRARVEKEIYPFSCKLKQEGSNHYISRKNKLKKAIKLTNKKTKEVRTYNSGQELAQKTGMNVKTITSRCQNNRTVDGITYEYLPQTKHSENPCKDKISKMGLLNKKAPEKFIPAEYKYNSVAVRQAILQGILDTDGHIKKSGECGLSTTSYQLATDVLEIVRSLGGKGSITPKKPKKGGYIKGRKIQGSLRSFAVSLRLPHLNPFYLKRKAERFKIQGNKWEQCDYITSVKKVGKKETQCIVIDHPSHLYITDDYIVTHNSIEEKMRPWLQPYADALNFLHTKSSLQNKKQSERKKNPSKEGAAGGPQKRPYDILTESGVVEVTAIEYIRGRSIPNRIFVLDETQNVAPRVLKTIASRMAEGSKLICLGDLEQIDNPYLDRYSNGLAHIRSHMKNLANASHITLLKGERSLLAEQAAKFL